MSTPTPTPERPRLLLIGRNSFLAREFVARNQDLSFRAIGHNEALEDSSYAGITCIVNFAFAPKLHESEYDASVDVDGFAAQRARLQGAHYVMISSRRVYAEDVQWNARESAMARGRDAYGRNKRRIETDLEAVLGDRLTILRPGNVVGFEATAGRQRIAAYMQNQLLREGRIRLTVSQHTRRDLVPVSYFCRVLRRVVTARVPGIYNVGAGAATAIGDAARWLIEGFGAGELQEESELVADEFQLDGTKLTQTFGVSCAAGELRDSLRASGVELAQQRSRSFN